ncbi:GDSL-type esterase/lipase family protein [Streptococcus sp. E24BD]|uniref:GDSL-type esterase/lipase family protein n=1 Tax=Streptococcus sp. E24BD TaxID=3278715 RepID=UPI00359E78EA
MHLLLLGDSLFARHEGKQLPHIDYSLCQYRPDVVIDNWAVSGDNSADLLSLLRRTLLPAADRVFVFIGANDLAQHKQVFLGEYAQNLTAIVAELKKQFSADQICLLLPAPVDETKQLYRTNRLVTYYGEQVRRVARQEGTGLLDTVALFEQSNLPMADLLKGSLDDGLHFGSQAYDFLARAMLGL